MIELPNDIRDLVEFDEASLGVMTREGKHREFKRDFVVNDFSDYSKARVFECGRWCINFWN